MPQAARIGDNSTGHDLCPPVPLVDGVSGNVFINGREAAVVGSLFAEHSCPSHLPHAGAVAAGSGSVFINGKPAARVGDPVTCGGSIAEGSDNVLIGG